MFQENKEQYIIKLIDEIMNEDNIIKKLDKTLLIAYLIKDEELIKELEELLKNQELIRKISLTESIKENPEKILYYSEDKGKKDQLRYDYEIEKIIRKIKNNLIRELSEIIIKKDDLEELI